MDSVSFAQTMYGCGAERKEGQDQIILMLNEKLKSWESTIGKSVAWDQASQLGLWSEKEHAFQKKKKERRAK